jgi:cytochrome c-type biogenesis protein CcmH
MILWIILTLMACAACVWIAIPLIRKFDRQYSYVTQTTAIYEEQLKEIERDANSGAIDDTAADAGRIEVQRRMLDAVKAQRDPRPLSRAWRGLALISTTGFVALASVLLYAQLGSPTLQPVLQSAPQPSASAVPTTGQVDEMVAKLERRLKSSPNDADGWRMLGWSYFNTQRYAQSAEAYKMAMTLDSGNLDYRAAYAEALVQGANGIVTPEAASEFVEVLKVDAQNPRALFYDALRMEQSGEKSAALEKWMALYKNAPPDAGWLTDVRSHIASIGQELGRDVSAFAQVSAAVPVPPVSQDDVAAIQSLPAGDQQEMIRSMVNGLAEKLDANPRNADGWIRLMRSRMVLADPENAKLALSKALKVFSDDPAMQTKLNAAAAEFGISEK